MLYYLFSGQALVNFAVLLGAILTLGLGWINAAFIARKADVDAAAARIDRIAFRLSISGEVTPHDPLGDYSDQDLVISVSNTGDQPIEVSKLAIEASMSESKFAPFSMNPSVIQARQTRHLRYSIGRPPGLETNIVEMTIQAEYGYPRDEALLALSQDLRVTFKPAGAVTYSESSTTRLIEARLPEEK